MRPALLVLLATLPGCLFTQDVNEPPTANLSLESISGTTAVGTPIDLYVTLYDDQKNPTSDFMLYDADGTTPVTDCVAQKTMIESGWQLTFWQAGTYVAKVVPKDHYGAIGSTASQTIHAYDVEPSLPDDDALVEGSAATACGANWPASTPIPLQLPEPAIDPDQSLVTPFPDGCGYPTTSTLKYSWTLTSQPTSAGRLGLATVTNGAPTCPSTPTSPALTLVGGTTVCLYPDPTVSSATPSTYGVSLAVSTDVGSVSPLSVMVPVLGDAPACLDGTYPAVGSYVVPIDQATVFEVIGADDTSPAGSLIYTWTVTRADGTSTVVQPATDGDDDGARLSLDPVALGVSVGETLTLRADVVEPGGTAPSCADSDDTCEVSSCVAASSTCPARATWTLEYR